MIFVILFAILIVALVVHLTARRLFDMEIEAAFAAVGKVAPVAVDRAALPPLVRAFAERAIGETGDLPTRVSFTQDAALKMRPEAEWTSVTARQVIGIGAPAFAWDARADIMPLVGMRVIDAYVGGEGRLRVRLLGSIPVANATGPEVNYGELYRYLAELPWAPQAILGNPALRWRQIDDASVEVAAETSDGDLARVRLTFDAAGDIVAIEADDRPREEKGAFLHTRWRGEFTDYRDFGGIRLPAHAEVSWLLDDGPFTYFRGDLVSYEAD